MTTDFSTPPAHTLQFDIINEEEQIEDYPTLLQSNEEHLNFVICPWRIRNRLPISQPGVKAEFNPPVDKHIERMQYNGHLPFWLFWAKIAQIADNLQNAIQNLMLSSIVRSVNFHVEERLAVVPVLLVISEKLTNAS